MYLRTPQLSDQIKHFRLDRIGQISCGLTPVPMSREGKIILHVVPLTAFDLRQTIVVGEIVKNPYNFPPLKQARTAGARVNMDGFLSYSNTTPGIAEQPAYCQVFRSGIVEAVSHAGNSTGMIIAEEIEIALVSGVLRYSNSLSQYGFEPPLVVLLSLVGVRGAVLRPTQYSWINDSLEAKVDRDPLLFTDVLLEALPRGYADAGIFLRPMLEQLANAAGLAEAPNFEVNGGYTPPTGQ
jgi:hypothetical protein